MESQNLSSSIPSAEGEQSLAVPHQQIQQQMQNGSNLNHHQDQDQHIQQQHQQQVKQEPSSHQVLAPSTDAPLQPPQKVINEAINHSQQEQEQHQDQQQQQHFYYNYVTKESQWEKPAGFDVNVPPVFASNGTATPTTTTTTTATATTTTTTSTTSISTTTTTTCSLGIDRSSCNAISA